MARLSFLFEGVAYFIGAVELTDDSKSESRRRTSYVSVGFVPHCTPSTTSPANNVNIER